MNEKKYYIVKNKYLADGLSFLGFRYYKFNDETGIVYSFEDTETFRKNLTAMLDLKKKMQ